MTTKVHPPPPRPLPPPPAELLDSPIYLLAVLYSARKSNDRPLERITRRRLEALGVHVFLGDELPPPERPKGGAE